MGLLHQYPHYIFTPRDVSNWLIGLLRYECKNDDELLCAWSYESMRIFRDKIVGNNSKKTYDNFLNSEITKLSSVFNSPRFLEYMFFSNAYTEGNKKKKSCQ